MAGAADPGEKSADSSAVPPEPGGQPGPPEGNGSDRFSRLTAAGATMRAAVREEVQAAVGQAFELVLERARADFHVEVGRLKSDVQRELEALEAKVQSIEESAAGDDPDLRPTLDRIAASLEETKAGVLRLQARYLPRSSPPAGG
jgi:hypothetical protein